MAVVTRLRNSLRFRAGFTLALLAVCGLALAGIKNSHLHLHPRIDAAKRTNVWLLEGTHTIADATKEASLIKAIQYYTTEDSYLDGMAVVTRALAGTISQYTVQLYCNDAACLRTAVDAYGSALAHAGTVDYATLIDNLEPFYIKSGTKMNVSVFFKSTTGDAAAAWTDATVTIYSHKKCGDER